MQNENFKHHEIKLVGIKIFRLKDGKRCFLKYTLPEVIGEEAKNTVLLFYSDMLDYLISVITDALNKYESSDTCTLSFEMKCSQVGETKKEGSVIRILRNIRVYTRGKPTDSFSAYDTFSPSGVISEVKRKNRFSSTSKNHV